MQYYSKYVKWKSGFQYLGQIYSSDIALLKQFIIKFHSTDLAEQFIAKMLENDISCSKEMLPLTTLNSMFPNASDMIRATCSLPMYESLTDAEIHHIVNVINSVFDGFEGA